MCLVLSLSTLACALFTVISFEDATWFPILLTISVLLLLLWICVLPVVVTLRACRLSEAHRRMQRDSPAFAFACGLQERLGAESPLLLAWKRDVLYDPHTLPLVLEYLA